MPARHQASQLFVVLYQSCPRQDYIRHTALRSLWLVIFVYSLVVAIITAMSDVAISVVIVLIVTAVFDCAAVVFSCLSLGFCVHHEKERVRDDMLRAGTGGDVRTQIALLKAAERRPSAQPDSPAESSPQLLLFEYANRRYWCVQPRRPDGDVPSTDECLEAAARETDRRTHEMAVGKAYFAMAVVSAVFNVISLILVSLSWGGDDAILFLGTIVPIIFFAVSTAATIVACALIPLPNMTGISLARSPFPVPAGVMSVNFSGEERAQAGTTSPAPYQEALPGPPLDELRLDTSDADEGRGKGVVAEANVPETPKKEKHTKEEKTAGELWVWGGFANRGSVPEAATVTAAADANSVEVRKVATAPPSAPAVTAPPADESESENFSPSEGSHSDISRLHGRL